MHTFLPRNWKTLWEDFEIFKSLILGVAMVVPVLLGFHLEKYPQGFCMALGVLLTFLPNIEGRTKHRIIGMLAALLLTSFLLSLELFIVKLGLIPTLAFLFTGFLTVSQLSVFGFRGGMVAFSGHLALIMGFAILEFKISIPEKIGFTALGSGLYLLLAAVFHKIHEPVVVRTHLAQVLEHTAELLKLRYARRFHSPELSLSQETALQLQLQKSQELLRELLYRKVPTPYYNKARLIFLESLDMYELALGRAAVGDVHFTEIPKEISDLASRNIIHLYGLSTAIRIKAPLPLDLPDPSLHEKAFKSIEQYVLQKGLPQARPDALFFQTILEEELEIEAHLSTAKQAFETQEGVLTSQPDQAFVHQEEYSFARYLRSFRWDSHIFLHSLRTALIMCIGYTIGYHINALKAYWIILTISVILRPNFGLTRKRAQERVVGTLMGSVVVGILVLFKAADFWYSLVAVPSLFLGFSYLQKNYKIAATYITIVILALHAVLMSNEWHIIALRILDTLIGAALALGSMYVLFPNWQKGGIQSILEQAGFQLAAYLEEVQRIYTSKKGIDIPYRLARKKATVAVLNVQASMQGLPVNEKKHEEAYQEKAARIQALLDAIASFGTFVQRQETTPPSPAFSTFISKILANLRGLQSTSMDLPLAQEDMDSRFKALEQLRDQQLKKGYVGIDRTLLKRLQEGKVVMDHLGWMHRLSEQLKK